MGEVKQNIDMGMCPFRFWTLRYRWNREILDSQYFDDSGAISIPVKSSKLLSFY